ncbi:MAG: hypothetical protein Q6358_08265 [Candidatus Brocadiales bacterium]|nr:hypothetical protein [Candidatus Brocadiales bacterium]
MSDKEKFSINDAVHGYLPLMHELATRIDLVAHACKGRLNLSPPYAREYTYLQFRYMCEIIALGCLQLHGDLPQAQKQSAKKEWNAEKIMKMLHGDYQHSFPQSVVRESTSQGWNIKADSKPNALTREEFKNLYIECGDVLHRGTIRSIQASGFFEDVDYQRVIDWQSKIVDLMNEHFIGRAKGAGFYVVSLRTTSGYPECNIFSPNQSGGFDVATRRMSIEGEQIS